MSHNEANRKGFKNCGAITQDLKLVISQSQSQSQRGMNEQN